METLVNLSNIVSNNKPNNIESSDDYSMILSSLLEQLKTVDNNTEKPNIHEQECLPEGLLDFTGSIKRFNCQSSISDFDFPEVTGKVHNIKGIYNLLNSNCNSKNAPVIEMLSTVNKSETPVYHRNSFSEIHPAGGRNDTSFFDRNNFFSFQDDNTKHCDSINNKSLEPRCRVSSDFTTSTNSGTVIISRQTSIKEQSEKKTRNSSSSSVSSVSSASQSLSVMLKITTHDCEKIFHSIVHPSLNIVNNQYSQRSGLINVKWELGQIKNILNKPDVVTIVSPEVKTNTILNSLWFMITTDGKNFISYEWTSTSNTTVTFSVQCQPFGMQPIKRHYFKKTPWSPAVRLGPFVDKLLEWVEITLIIHDIVLIEDKKSYVETNTDLLNI